MSILLKNGTIIDGSGNPSFVGDIFIDEDRIANIGSVPDGATPDEVIDAKGLVVAPGFIDTHSHSDVEIFLDPEVRPKVMQGITTEILGQDGVSVAPLPKEYESAWRKNLAGLDGDSDEINWDFPDVKSYLDAIEAVSPGLNECYLLPHGNVRMEAMGLDNRDPSDDELQKMRDIVRRDMEGGAYGLSSGLIYLPCLYSKTDELVELCRVTNEYDGVFVVHQRSEADDIVNSMKEIIDIGMKSGIKTHWSHFKLCGKNNAGKLEEQLSLFNGAKENGLRVSFDQYPYIAGSTMLGVILPPWMHDGGTDKLLKRLEDPALRKKAVYDIENGLPGWDNFVAFAGLDGIFVTSVKTEKNKDIIGLNLEQIGEKRGKNTYDAVFDLLHDESNAVGMYDYYGLEEHVVRFMTMDEQNVCTDGLLGGKPHPRVYGSFPRVLGRYCREKKALSWSQAVRKMTGKPAEVFGLESRGLLREGYFADICVFNPETIIDKGTFADPTQYPDGIEHVIINGKLAVRDGKYTGNRNGRVLRKNQKA